MEMWLEHLWWGDGEGAGPVKLEKAERRPYQCTQISGDDGARHFSVCPATGKGARGTKRNTGCSIWIWEKASLRVAETGTGCPERLWSPFSQDTQNLPVSPAWGWPCMDQTIPRGPFQPQQFLDIHFVQYIQTHWYENIKKDTAGNPWESPLGSPLHLTSTCVKEGLATEWCKNSQQALSVAHPGKHAEQIHHLKAPILAWGEVKCYTDFPSV